MISATGVPPGSRVKCVEGVEPAMSGFMARTRVDLPEKSGPSTVTKMPRRVLCAAGLPARPQPCARRDALPPRRAPRRGSPAEDRPAHSLGVPLDTEQPTLGEVPSLDRLDYAIRREPVATSPSARSLIP